MIAFPFSDLTELARLKDRYRSNPEKGVIPCYCAIRSTAGTAATSAASNATGRSSTATSSCGCRAGASGVAPVSDPAYLEARRFIEQETQFHLGMLPTEGSHPKTRDFSATIQRDTAAGAAMLLSVDHDIPPRAAEVFRSAAYDELVQAIVRSTREGRRIGFSGCGATGRLAIILERMWRQFWEEEARAGGAEHSWAAECRRRAERGCSIMTGGDRALIRSVENFEDFQVFGRRQVRDLGLSAGDVLVAITEGGETSSVIGTAWEAHERGCAVFFVFNNPADVLAAHIERSRAVIECPGIVKIDLATGPMALSGSTRLQATSAEMLVVGAALEQAAVLLVREGRHPFVRRLDCRRTTRRSTDLDYAAAFEGLVDALSSGPRLAGIAAAIDLESEDLPGRRPRHLRERGVPARHHLRYDGAYSHLQAAAVPHSGRHQLAALLGLRQGPRARNARGVAPYSAAAAPRDRLDARGLRRDAGYRAHDRRSARARRRGDLPVRHRQRARCLPVRGAGLGARRRVRRRSLRRRRCSGMLRRTAAGTRAGRSWRSTRRSPWAAPKACRASTSPSGSRAPR